MTTASFDEFMAELESAAAAANPETPMAQGTFAIWATPGGGFVIAARVADGPYAGEYQRHISPRIIKAAKTFAKVMGKKLGM